MLILVNFRLREVLRHWAMSQSGADYTHVNVCCQPVFVPIQACQFGARAYNPSLTTATEPNFEVLTLQTAINCRHRASLYHPGARPAIAAKYNKTQR
jgi:hypothetical protein